MRGTDGERGTRRKKDATMNTPTGLDKDRNPSVPVEFSGAKAFDSVHL